MFMLVRLKTLSFNSSELRRNRLPRARLCGANENGQAPNLKRRRLRQSDI